MESSDYESDYISDSIDYRSGGEGDSGEGDSGEGDSDESDNGIDDKYDEEIEESNTNYDSYIAKGEDGEQRHYSVAEMMKVSRTGEVNDLILGTFSNNKMETLMNKLLVDDPAEYTRRKLVAGMESSIFTSRYETPLLSSADKVILFKTLPLFIPTSRHYINFNVMLYIYGYIANKQGKAGGKEPYATPKIIYDLYDERFQPFNITVSHIIKYTRLVGNKFREIYNNDSYFV
jgi:hypothetical protein